MSGADFQVFVDQDAPPIAKTQAHEIRRLLYVGHRQHLVPLLPRCFALVSTVDSQKVSIFVSGNVITVKAGRAKSASVVIHLDFARMADPSFKRKIEGLYRHPIAAFRVGQFLAPVKPSWPDDAKRFWQQVNSEPERPACLVLTSLTDGRSITLGEGDPTVRISGKPDDLVSFLTGGKLLVQDIMLGRIKIESSLKQIAILTGITQKLMLGELDQLANGDN